ncbi:hypothetical protein CCO03_18655 [Comamonas serinivorans]|uniref:Major facilitator superfamily (MFS) profile domain-containing protein n=1 Tax=Comamonas serinivorans TaxID=1082851 RepID=A0A1Y0ESM1_9BURK|nr:MFS transporter [Comamonas serinivorans]ARU06410.1 hypothetical protein CCO03_18655 [Comamonas serinivorans]
MRFVRELDEYPTGAKRRKILTMAVLASLICSYEGAIAPVVPLLLKDLNMSLSTYGLITAISFIFGAIASLLGGKLADKYGRVRVLIPMMAVCALLAYSMVLVNTATELAVLRCILAFVDAIAITTTAPLVRDFSPRMGRAQALGFWTWGPVGANFLSAGIAAITLPLFNNSWHSQFVIIGTISLVASIYIAMNIADLSPRLRAEVLQTERKVIEDASHKQPAPESSLLRHPVVWAHCIGIGFWLAFYLTITAFGQTIMVQAFGKTASEASSIMAGFWVMNLIAVAAVGRWSDKLQLRRVFPLGFTLILLVLLAYFAHLMEQPATPTWTLVIVGTLIGGAMGSAYSPWMALYSENAEDIDPRLQGMAWGLFYFVVRIVAVAVVILGPLTVEHTQSWRVWVLISGGCTFVFLIAMLFFKGPWTHKQRLAGPQRADTPLTASSH